MSSKAYGKQGDGPGTVHGFYTHLMIYLLVNGLLLALNLLAGGPAWAVWPLLGWGVGLVAHGSAASFGTPHGSGADRISSS